MKFFDIDKNNITNYISPRGSPSSEPLSNSTLLLILTQY